MKFARYFIYSGFLVALWLIFPLSTDERALSYVDLDECNKPSHKDDFTYNQVGTIEGKIEILNHPKLGKIPGNYQYIIFQRLDCKKCIIAVHGDTDGNYKVNVGLGKYKVIVKDGNREEEMVDILAPEQPRCIEVKSSIKDVKFDIKIMLPKD